MTYAKPTISVFTFHLTNIYQAPQQATFWQSLLWKPVWLLLNTILENRFQPVFFWDQNVYMKHVWCQICWHGKFKTGKFSIAGFCKSMFLTPLPPHTHSCLCQSTQDSWLHFFTHRNHISSHSFSLHQSANPLTAPEIWRYFPTSPQI